MKGFLKLTQGTNLQVYDVMWRGPKKGTDENKVMRTKSSNKLFVTEICRTAKKPFVVIFLFRKIGEISFK